MPLLALHNKLWGNKHWGLQGCVRKLGHTGPVWYLIPGSLVSAGSHTSVCWLLPSTSGDALASASAARVVPEWICPCGPCWFSCSTLQPIPLSSHLLEKSGKNDHWRSSSTYSFMNDVGLEKEPSLLRINLSSACPFQTSVSYFFICFADVEVNFTSVRKCFHNKIHLFQININPVLWDVRSSRCFSSSEI